jgi:hypothetical protein
MTTGAGQTFLCVYVLTELLLGDSKAIGQRRMTIQAGVWDLPIAQTGSEQEIPCYPDPAGCNEWTEIISQGSHK